ncbi:Protein of unknown function [Gemmobacter aquatilis]|uniref:DUF1499 domain-containing protein n=1 Tax=Gemmobacter aquatilis TaxID=933059 RepID=A0A1H8B3A5_9RHOB|nr:DUF1499 domain-containing protein [Gemmobacter aquatilis]SEM77381.1 Protein of unknown function [Gemmobacter aquatilis]
MKWIALVTFGLPLLALLCFATFVRLAPMDPARWHVGLEVPMRTGKPNDLRLRPEGGEIAAPVFAEPPEALAARIAALALAEPHTLLLAGSAASQHMTFVQRSALWGFPDIITVETLAVPGGSTLRLWSRSRFGYSDMGVNRARASRWLAALR